MRPPTIVVAALLTLASLAGCGLLQSEQDEEIERLLNASAAITVFVRVGVTPQQKTDIEARLRAVPDVTDVVFEDQEVAHAKMEKLFADEPEKMPEVEPSDLPESFVMTMKDQAAVRNVRDSRVHTDLKALPGVADLVIRCTTVDECKEIVRRRNAPTPAVTF